MSVLSENTINDRLARSPSDPRSLVITPRGEKAIQKDAVDVRLGSRFLVPYPYKVPYIDFEADEDAARFQNVIHVPAGEHIVVPAFSTVLGALHEYIKLPYDVAAQLLTRSSLARHFVTIEGASWVHPLYRGCLTLEIGNASGVPVMLHPEQAIGQLIFFAVEGAIEPPNGDMVDRHLGPIFPEIPRPARHGDMHS